MPRIKIKDLPRDVKISKEELKRVMGGYGFYPVSQKTYPVGKLTLKPEPLVGSYNAPYFVLRDAELDSP